MFPTTIQILLAEDSEVSRSIIKEILARLGYAQVIEACDGTEAFDKLEELNAKGTKIDLIISDWSMPRQSGLDLLVKLKSMADYNTIPFLMTTAEQDLSLITLAISSGADEFISKPITQDEMEVKLQNIWAQLNKPPET